MKKIKSYTLIEIVIASFIFMVVAIMAMVSFSMVRSANEKAATLKNAGECREILQNYVQSEVTNSTSISSTTERIMGVKSVVGGYQLEKIAIEKSDLSDTPASTRYAGIAMFQQASGKYKVVYKEKDATTDAYHYYVAQTPNSSLGSTVNFTGSELLKGGSGAEISCVSSNTPPNPFAIIAVKRSDTEHSFKVDLGDKIYTQYGTTVPTFSSDKNFAATQIEVINSDMGI